MNICCCLVLAALAPVIFAADNPKLGGRWALNVAQSKSDFPPVAKMTIEQTSTRVRMAQSDRDGRSAHSLQGDCVTDGKTHAVPDADDETITCRWDGAVLVTEQKWGGRKQNRLTRTSLNPEGMLVQDIRTTGPDGAKSGHLVWVKQDTVAEPAPNVAQPAPTPAPQDMADAPLPAPYATPSADNHQRVVPGIEPAVLHSLENFEVSLWAADFQAPRYMLQGRNREVLLADAGFDVNSASPVQEKGKAAANGIVYVFPEGDPARRKALLTGLDRPYGMALWKDFLYVAEAESIKRYPYDGVALQTGKGQEIISLKGFNKGHWTRTLLFDDAGTKLYVGIGSQENVDEGEDPRRAAINRYNPDGSGHEIFASGTRNPIGLHFYPATQTLWSAVQERDELGDGLVPDYFTHVEKGAFYGWPWTYIGDNQDPRMKAAPKELAEKTVEPDELLGSHVAVLDFRFYTGDQFPTEFHGGAFLALHGSWNSSKREGYSVRFIPFRDGEPSGKGYDFLAGWTDSGDEKTVLGRPSGVFQAADGSLLISDDGSGRIWKVTYKTPKATR
jgi:glucose/arabinose dehydrogenase